LPEGSISPIPETTVERNPLTDPRAGDIVADSQGAVIEALEVELGQYASVLMREDSHTCRVMHDTWREIVKGGRVIHRAEEVQS
jgi:hypothetical protein